MSAVRQRDPRLWPVGEPMVQGHRGARGLVVESTLPGFARAWELGCGGVELDVLLTADGHVVVWHDPVILADKVICEEADYVGALVADLTLDQLRTLDVGSRTLPAFPGQEAVPRARIPLLREVFEAAEAAGWAGWFTVEIKSVPSLPGLVPQRDRLVAAAMGQIHAAGIARRALVHSFDWAVLRFAEREDPSLLRSALASYAETFVPGSAWLGGLDYADFGGDLVAAVEALGAHVVSPAYQLRPGTKLGDGDFGLACDGDFVARAHAAGLAVLPWTVNEIPDAAAVLAAGVDGLVTDYPDRMLPLVG